MFAEGKVRNFFSKLSEGLPQALGLTRGGALGVADVIPSRMEATRAGKRFFIGNNAAITGIANVTALPTTAAQWTISNRDANDSLIFEEIGMYLTSGTPGVGGILLGCLFQTPSQTATGLEAGVGLGSANGITIAGNVVVEPSTTITQPAAPVWYPLATNPSPNVTAFAASTYLEHRNLQGSLIVPPLWGLGLAVVAPAGTTPLFAPFAMFLKMPLDIG